MTETNIVDVEKITSKQVTLDIDDYYSVHYPIINQIGSGKVIKLTGFRLSKPNTIADSGWKISIAISRNGNLFHIVKDFELKDDDIGSAIDVIVRENDIYLEEGDSLYVRFTGTFIVGYNSYHKAIIAYDEIADEAIITSLDRSALVLRTTPVSTTLNGVTYGGGKFVAVGHSGVILTSTDGITWTARTSNTTENLFFCIYANGLYVAVGNGGVIVTSSDGITWTSQTTPITTNLRGIAYGNGTFVVVGFSGTVLTSSNGTSWSSQSGLSGEIRSVAYGNSYFVIVGNGGAIYTSTNGTSFVTRTSGHSNNHRGVTYENNRFIAVGTDGTVVTSLDGITWKLRISNQTSTPINKVFWQSIYINDKHYAVGHDASIIKSEHIPYLINGGVNWEKYCTGGYSNKNFYGIAQGNNTVVVVGEDGYIVSSKSRSGLELTSRRWKYASGTTYNLNWESNKEIDTVASQTEGLEIVHDQNTTNLTDGEIVKYGIHTTDRGQVFKKTRTENWTYKTPSSHSYGFNDSGPIIQVNGFTIVGIPFDSPSNSNGYGYDYHSLTTPATFGCVVVLDSSGQVLQVLIQDNTVYTGNAFFFGSNVAISSDKTRLAIGARQIFDNSSNYIGENGLIFIYTFNPSTGAITTTADATISGTSPSLGLTLSTSSNLRLYEHYAFDPKDKDILFVSSHARQGSSPYTYGLYIWKYNLSNLSSITVTGGDQRSQLEAKGNWNDTGWNSSAGDDNSFGNIVVSSKYVVIGSARFHKGFDNSAYGRVDVFDHNLNWIKELIPDTVMPSGSADRGIYLFGGKTYNYYGNVTQRLAINEKVIAISHEDLNSWTNGDSLSHRRFLVYVFDSNTLKFKYGIPRHYYNGHQYGSQMRDIRCNAKYIVFGCRTADFSQSNEGALDVHDIDTGDHLITVDMVNDAEPNTEAFSRGSSFDIDFDSNPDILTTIVPRGNSNKGMLKRFTLADSGTPSELTIDISSTNSSTTYIHANSSSAVATLTSNSSFENTRAYANSPNTFYIPQFNINHTTDATELQKRTGIVFYLAGGNSGPSSAASKLATVDDYSDASGNQASPGLFYNGATGPYIAGITNGTTIYYNNWSTNFAVECTLDSYIDHYSHKMNWGSDDCYTAFRVYTGAGYSTGTLTGYIGEFRWYATGTYYQNNAYMYNSSGTQIRSQVNSYFGTYAGKFEWDIRFYSDGIYCTSTGTYGANDFNGRGYGWTLPNKFYLQFYGYALGTYCCSGNAHTDNILYYNYYA